MRPGADEYSTKHIRAAGLTSTEAIVMKCPSDGNAWTADENAVYVKVRLDRRRDTEATQKKHRLGMRCSRPRRRILVRLKNARIGRNSEPSDVVGDGRGELAFASRIPKGKVFRLQRCVACDIIVRQRCRVHRENIRQQWVILQVLSHIWQIDDGCDADGGEIGRVANARE